MIIVGRDAWKAAPHQGRQYITHPVSDLYVHHTGTAFDGTSIGGEATAMRSIQRFHQHTRGWADIGYSYVVFPSGRIYAGRGFGVVGAHTEGHNSRSYGICFAGNFDTQQPTGAALEAARQLIRHGVAHAFITKPFKIAGHRDVKATACPGHHLYGRLAELGLPPKEEPVSELVQVNAPIVNLVPTPTGKGYWLVCSDGGVFSFGDAQYYGRVEYRGA